MDLYEKMVDLVPLSILQTIYEGKLIDKALHTNFEDPAMVYLFDVYEEFVDKAGEFDNITCYKCREAILSNWKKMQPYIVSKLILL